MGDELHQRYHAHRAERIMRQASLAASPAAQVVEIERCRRDVVTWVNNWAWTQDPREPVASLPLVCFPFQERYLRWLDEREATQTGGIVEKSRDSGMTWLTSAFMLHRWLFVPGWHGSVGSRKLDLVDQLGNPDCIFEKIRYLLRQLPPWFTDACASGFSWRKYSGEAKLKNPGNDSTITGEGGDQRGRGGRSSFYFNDEAAFGEHQELVDRALASNTNVRIDGSTPNGPGNVFARRRSGGSVAVFTMHWREDPRKNAWQVLRDGVVLDSGPGGTDAPAALPAGASVVYPWYERMKATLQNPVAVAQELDIDYTASIEGIINPAPWVRAAIALGARLAPDPHGQIVAGLDVADGGDDSTVLVLRQGVRVLSTAVRTQGNTVDTAYWALALARAAGASIFNYDPVGVGAGVAGVLATAKREQREKAERHQPHDAWLLKLAVHGINVGDRPGDARWPDGRTSAERFANLKAELWWTVARRLEKTWQVVEGIADYPVDELLLLPDDPDLTTQLSNVLGFATESGKQMVESKDELRKRGVKSPNHAEALMLTEARAKTVRVG